MPIIEDLIDVTRAAIAVLVAIVIAFVCILLQALILVLPWLVIIAAVAYIAVHVGAMQWIW